MPLLMARRRLIVLANPDRQEAFPLESCILPVYVGVHPRVNQAEP